MKYICPLCEIEGHISEDNLEHPITRTICRQCGTILLFNPDTGGIDAYKSPFRGTREYALTGSQESDKGLPVSKMHPPPPTSPRDWTAVITVMLVVVSIISAGIYLMLS